MPLDGTETGQYESNSPEQTYSPHDFSPINRVEMHMAERLVESTTENNAFKFDTITPLQLIESQDIQSNATDMGKLYILKICWVQCS